VREINGAEFGDVALCLSDAVGVLTEAADATGGPGPDVKGRLNLPSKIAEAIAKTGELGFKLDLKAVLMQWIKIKERLAEDAGLLPSRDAAILLKELWERLQEGLTETPLIHLRNETRKAYWGHDNPFGDKVREVFPEVVYDVDEATKCIALERDTAAVHHLMLVMEVGVQRLARRLKIKKPRRPWGELTTEISHKVRRRKEAKTAIAFNRALDHLSHVRKAIRNPTAHPGTQYSQHQAEFIFANTREFMNELTAIL
jgi:hypothetical protein